MRMRASRSIGALRTIRTTLIRDFFMPDWLVQYANDAPGFTPEELTEIDAVWAEIDAESEKYLHERRRATRRLPSNMVH